MSKIEWTEQTWNPMIGCSRVSAGCDHCYAEGQVHRFGARYDRASTTKVGATRRAGLTFLPVDGDGKSIGKGAKWTGAVWLLPDVLEVPLKRRKPTTYFVNSLSDVFHESVVGCEEGRRFIAAMFGVMAACPQHTFQVLTKRPEQARKWFAWLDQQPRACRPDGLPAAEGERVLGWVWRGDAWDLDTPEACNFVAESADHASTESGASVALQDMDPADSWPLPNVWLLVSVEDQPTADERIPILLDLPAAVRGLSVEPMLGPIDLGDRVTSCDWIICGGESGPKARPMHPAWPRSLREQCAVADVPYFFKQWGAWGSVHDASWTHTMSRSGKLYALGDRMPMVDVFGVAFVRRVGKAAAGRELDGRTWDEYPRGES